MADIVKAVVVKRIAAHQANEPRLLAQLAANSGALRALQDLLVVKKEPKNDK